ncbi:hypothetical protein HPP92_025786 [Vanilla planifolia]|uniref:DUF7138 domain-containing protein n=1 Tax=Vanilla planifolia TaxID=51239 RepID=A0A835PL43_VANPL|nr:hypothetical protein HPP92_026079 [Vanilla planifolia]KAG0452237.1 hypothetical protein HPP92_025786 [Vanilla planifolia]
MGEFAESTPAASFPVFFFDGKKEISVGNVLVHPGIEFLRFQTLIAHKIGLSPHEITMHLVRRKKVRESLNTSQKVLIDGSSDFAAIARERDCVVLAKRSKRTRPRRRGAPIGAAEQRKSAAIPQDKKILRRNQADGSMIDDPYGGWVSHAARFGLCYEYDDSGLRNLQRQRERYLLSTAAAYEYAAAAVNFPDPSSGYDGGLLGGRPLETAPASARSAVCENCLRAEAEGRPASFHWCVFDAVTVGFRSPVGPIQRPPKKHIEASA